jgi:anti-sigma B factor antagonist
MHELIVAATVAGSERTRHVRIAGELTFDTAPRARADLFRAFAPGTPDIVLDLSELDLLDSSGVAVLVAAWRRLADEGRRFEIRRATGQPHRVLAMTGCLEVFTALAPAGEVAV